jgi:hypothetical protein
MTKPKPNPANSAVAPNHLIPLRDIELCITRTIIAIDHADAPYREALAVKNALKAFLNELETSYAKPK